MTERTTRMGQLAQLISVDLDRADNQAPQPERAEKSKRTKPLLIKNKSVKTQNRPSLEQVAINPAFGE